MHLPGFDGPAAPPPLATFFVGTRHGHLLQVRARSRREAVMLVERAVKYGPVLDVETEAAYRERNRPAEEYRRRHICRFCGAPRAICGGWCVLGPEAQH